MSRRDQPGFPSSRPLFNKLTYFKLNVRTGRLCKWLLSTVSIKQPDSFRGISSVPRNLSKASQFSLLHVGELKPHRSAIPSVYVVTMRSPRRFVTDPQISLHRELTLRGIAAAHFFPHQRSRRPPAEPHCEVLHLSQAPAAPTSHHHQ